jgi:hypothetical protein
MEGIREQLGLYREILELSRKEERRLEQGDVRAVFSDLPDKMDRIRRVTEWDDRLETFKREWTERRERGETLGPELVGVLKEVEDILEQTIRLDEKNKRTLMQLLRMEHWGAAGNTGRSGIAAHALKAYGKKPPE